MIKFNIKDGDRVDSKDYWVNANEHSFDQIPNESEVVVTWMRDGVPTGVTFRAETIHKNFLENVWVKV